MNPFRALRSQRSAASFSHVLIALIALVAAAPLAVNAQTDGQQQFAELGNCPLESGQQITGCRLGYRTWGKLNTEGTNAVLVPTWFTGTSAQLGESVITNKFADPAK